MKIDPNKLIDALRCAGYEPYAYSGRGMDYECVAVNPDDMPGGVFSLGARLGEEFAELRPREDSLGRETVLYFRSVRWPS